MNDPRPRRVRRGAGLLAMLAATVLVVGACGAAPLSAVAGATGVAAAASADPVPSASSAPANGSSDTDSLADAKSLQSAMVSIIQKVTPAVVVIETSSGLGSGVIYDTAGHIVTNAHVVGTDKTFKVTLSTGKVYTGTLVGSYAPDDIAVIKIDATGLTPAVFGDSGKLQVGDIVLAMGAPLGLQSSVTEGIVSAVGRSVPEPTGNTLPDVVQTSAAINPGNSGGALVDLNGQVVGIPTLSAADPQIGGSAPGIGFAISSNRARLVAQQLIATGKVTASGRAYLGVEIQDTAQGVVIVSTVSGGPAEKAGIKAGDLVVSINGQAISVTDDIGSILAKLQPGDVVSIVVKRSGATQTINVTLGQLPG